MAVRFIDVLSDSTGATGERVVRAALLQFPDAEVKLRLHPRVRTKAKAEPILRAVAADSALLVFSVVSPELSRFIYQLSAELHIEAVDVIGSLIGRLETFLSHKPVQRPGPLLPLTESYFRRIEAVEFTVKADAGRNPRSFLKADLILVGVSRTSKTPLATLLAHHGFKVANQTIVLGAPPPAELLAAPQNRILGLTIDADSLCDIRKERLVRLGLPPESQYGVREHVESEISYAEKLFKDNNWPSVDMSERSVEETASIILEMIRHEALPRAQKRSQPPRF